MEKSNKVLTSLIGLKGIFAVGIVLYHSNASFYSPLKEFFFFFYKYGGWIGNIIFFMLSGFLISYGYKEKIEYETISFLVYLRRRVAKVYPLFLVTNMVQFLLLLYTNDIARINMKVLLLNMTMFVSGWCWPFSPYNYPGWFVCVVFLCYIIYYFVCWVSKRRKKLYMFFLFGLVIFGFFLEMKKYNLPFLYLADGQGIFNFFIGCGLYEFYVQILDLTKKKIAIGVSIIAMGIFVFISCKDYEMLAQNEGILFSVVFCPAIIICSLEIGWLICILNHSVFQFLGKISMPMYYWHIPVLTIMSIIQKKYILKLNNIVQYILFFTCLGLISKISNWVDIKWKSLIRNS